MTVLFVDGSPGAGKSTVCKHFRTARPDWRVADFFESGTLGLDASLRRQAFAHDQSPGSRAMFFWTWTLAATRSDRVVQNVPNLFERSPLTSFAIAHGVIPDELNRQLLIESVSRFGDNWTVFVLTASSPARQIRLSGRQDPVGWHPTIESASWQESHEEAYQLAAKLLLGSHHVRRVSADAPLLDVVRIIESVVGPTEG